MYYTMCNFHISAVAFSDDKACLLVGCVMVTADYYYYFFWHLCFSVKCPSNDWMHFHEIWFRCSFPPEDEL